MTNGIVKTLKIGRSAAKYLISTFETSEAKISRNNTLFGGAITYILCSLAPPF